VDDESEAFRRDAERGEGRTERVAYGAGVGCGGAFWDAVAAADILSARACVWRGVGGLTNDEYGRVVVEEHERAQARSDAEGGAGGSHVRGEQLGEGGAAARLLHKPDRAAEQEGEDDDLGVRALAQAVRRAER